MIFLIFALCVLIAGYWLWYYHRDGGFALWVKAVFWPVILAEILIRTLGNYLTALIWDQILPGTVRLHMEITKKLIEKTPRGRLYSTLAPGGIRVGLLKVQDSSGKYTLIVPGEHRTVQSALAWTAGLLEYAPEIEL